jgi:hypothetical protein
MAKCPHCDGHLPSISGEVISIQTKGHQWAGMAYCCPLCDAVLSVTIDQVALKSDTVGEVLRGLGKA